MQGKKRRKTGLLTKKRKYNVGGSFDCPNPPCPPVTPPVSPGLDVPGPTDQGEIRPDPQGVPPNAAWMYQAMPAFQDKDGMAAAAKWTEENPLSSSQGLNMMGMLNALGTKALAMRIPGTAIGGLQGSELTLGHIFNAYLLNEGIEGFKRDIPEFFNDPSWEGLKNLGIDALEVMPASLGLYSDVVKPVREIYRSARSYYGTPKWARDVDLGYVEFVDDAVDPVTGALNQLKNTVQKPMSVVTRPPSQANLARARQLATDEVLDLYAVEGGLQESLTMNRHFIDELDDIARAYAAKRNIDFEEARSFILNEIEKKTPKHYGRELGRLPGSLMNRPYDTRFPESGNRIRMRFLNPNSKLWQQATKDGLISLNPLSKSLSSNDLSDLEKIVLKESIFASPVFNKSGQPLEGDALAKARKDITAFLNGDLNSKAVKGYRLNLNFLKGTSEQTTFVQDPIYTMELDPNSSETYFGEGLQKFGRSYVIDKKPPSNTYRTYGLGRLGVNYENPTTYIVGTDHHASYMSHFKRGEMAHFRTFDEQNKSFLPDAIRGRDISDGYNLYGLARINGKLTDVGSVPVFSENGGASQPIFRSEEEKPFFNVNGGVGSLTIDNFDASTRLFDRFISDHDAFRGSGIFNLQAQSTFAPGNVFDRASFMAGGLHYNRALSDLSESLSDFEDMIDLTVSQADEFSRFSADYWNRGKSSIANYSTSLKTFEPGGDTGKYVAEAVEAYEQGLITESQKDVLITAFNKISDLLKEERQLLSFGGDIKPLDKGDFGEKMVQLHPELESVAESEMFDKVIYGNKIIEFYSERDFYSDFAARNSQQLLDLFTDMGYDMFKINLNKPVSIGNRWHLMNAPLFDLTQYMNVMDQSLQSRTGSPILLDTDYFSRLGPFDKGDLEKLNESQKQYASRMRVQLDVAYQTAKSLNDDWQNLQKSNPNASIDEFTQQNIDTVKKLEQVLGGFSKSLVEGQNVIYSFLGDVSSQANEAVSKYGHLMENAQRYSIETVNNLLSQTEYTLVPELLGIHQQVKSAFSLVSDFLDDFDGKVVPTLSSELFNQADRFYVAEIQSDFSQKAKAIPHLLDSKYATPRSGDYRSPYNSSESGNDAYYTEKGVDPYVDSFAKNWQVKVVQQAVLKGIERGKREILFPYPKTAKKIQNWPDGYEKDPKYKALYDTYKNIQKTIQKATGIKPTKFTDEAGNEWWMIKVDPKQNYEFPDFKHGGKIRLRKK